MKQEEKEMNPYQKELVPFDPMILIHEALKKWLLVVVAAVIAGMLAFIYTDSGYVPYYSTSCTLVLSTRDSNATIYDQLDATSSLAEVFSEVLNSSVMRNNILDELQMDSFDGSIQAAAIESTNLLTVQVTAGDPRTAFRVMRVLLEKHDMVTYAVMGDIVLEILEPPVVPTAPYNAADALHAFKTAAAATGAAIFVMLVILAYFKDVVRSKAEAEEKLACWCLGEIRHERKRGAIIDLLRRRKRGILISDPLTGFRYANTLGKLARRVEQNMQGGKILLVTSVLENEGKTTVSANLALALAKKYPKVLLVDCDLRKPACRKIMNQPFPEHYVQNVIRGEVLLADAVKTDVRSRMQLLMAKRSTPQEAGELIGTRGMELLLEQARQQYDYVVLDMPPMSAAPDAEAIMELADAGLLVIRQNVVSVTDLNRAIEDLQRGKGKLLGCVLNDVLTTKFFSGEGYRTGYGSYRGYSRYGRYGRYGAYAQEKTGE